jgi:hypothetical protein
MSNAMILRPQSRWQTHYKKVHVLALYFIQNSLLQRLSGGSQPLEASQLLFTLSFFQFTCYRLYLLRLPQYFTQRVLMGPQFTPPDWTNFFPCFFHQNPGDKITYKTYRYMHFFFIRDLLLQRFCLVILSHSKLRNFFHSLLLLTHLRCTYFLRLLYPSSANGTSIDAMWLD